MAAVPVWDLPTRLFHWSLAALFALGYATGGEDGLSFAVHVLCGYGIALLILFRLAWGVIGSPRSRFADFIRPRAELRRYAAALARLRPPRTVGHNPLGGWMIVALLAVLALVVATGAFSAEDEAAGPLAPLVSPGLAKALSEVHEALGEAALILVVIHILGVLADWLLTGENLIGAMITGRKELDPAAAAAEPPLAPSWLAVAVALALAVAGAYAIARTDFARPGPGRDDDRAAVEGSAPAPVAPAAERVRAARAGPKSHALSA